MIDCIHITTPKINTTWLHDTKRSITLEDGVKSCRISKLTLENFKVDSKKNGARIKGSIHKWYRIITTGDWDNNHDQFSYREVCTAIDTLCEILNIAPEECCLHGLEFALNLETSFDPKEVISNNIICHRNIYDPKRDDKKSDGYIVYFPSDNWILKIYDKGKHQGKDAFIFRLEIKTRRKPKKINTLAGLKELSTWELMKSTLVKMVDDLIILDDPENQKDFGNPLYWERLRRKSKKDRHKFKRKFDKIPQSKYKQELYQLIETTFANLIHHENTSSSTYQEKDKTTRLHTIYSGIRDTKGVCQVTGIDISHQRKGARFVSEKTIREKISSETFKDLELKYLPIDKRELSKERRAYFIAHNIRNQYHNPRQLYRRLHEGGQMMLQIM